VVSQIASNVSASASQHLKGLRTKNDDQKTGLEIVREALSYPARQIAINAGEDGSVMRAYLWRLSTFSEDLTRTFGRGRSP
jgi:chaperonin GroEL (HSP60 family)